MIHSFWVPELAGTQDVVPGVTNHLTIQADEPGVYEGQCKEFCGLSHAYMKFVVVAHSPDDFDQWVSDQQADAAMPEPGSDAAAGARSSSPSARRCHAIQGPRGRERRSGRGQQRRPEPHAPHEPELLPWVHAGDERREPAGLAGGPGQGRAGSFMPDYGLSPEELDQMVAFLNTLE